MIEAIKRALNLRNAYKRTFDTREGEQVVQDLIRKYVLSNPAKGNADVTMFNLGKQQCAIEILKKIFISDEAFRKAMEKAAEQTTNEIQ